jgi:hypothetical protein
MGSMKECKSVCLDHAGLSGFLNFCPPQYCVVISLLVTLDRVKLTTVVITSQRLVDRLSKI